ncbi:acyl-CoA N-acyltransferase [Punctularia strigosozonata HHB-11173 SS5]|uniref:acyl-CoA N-acyltransferase n=1 Tax=Punctularia strigosozonata (strain HHB-11173) TaxID=741275 RepID=UPI00044182B4|nr:acyl-CoA N-acyltransferase [Punctularia strigosozonata HHB-11173 SS5]EIN06923.1 acyl-CoA N-acyltransferase [Punctularia strigosozonata HHB-11173 SS5]
MIASTKNLHIRELRESDLDRLVTLQHDPTIMRSGPAYPVPKGPTYRKQLEALPDHTLITVMRGDALFVGMMTLSIRIPKNRDAQFGIALVDKWRGKGYGTEMTEWIVGYAFEQLAVHRISLGVLEWNAAAISVYKKVGFVEEGRKRKCNWQDGKWQDMVFMGILEEEWLARAQQT